jgi:hypothetical protein
MMHHLGSFCYFLRISLLKYLHFGIFQTKTLTNPEKSQKTLRLSCRGSVSGEEDAYCCIPIAHPGGFSIF